MLGLLHVWLYATQLTPQTPPTRIQIPEFTKDNATVLLNRFKRAIQFKNQASLYKVITIDYTIHRCESSIENRDHFWELIKQVSNRMIPIYDQIDIIKADSKSITANIDGAKVVFDLWLWSNGEYQLWKETHYDCSRKGVLSSMVINYHAIALGNAKRLMRFYIKGIRERSLTELSKAIDDPYQLFYCLKTGEVGLRTLSNFDEITFPNFPADVDRRKTLIEFRNVQLFSNGSIIFSVHNSGFNHYFEARKKDRDNYTLILEKQLDCSDAVPRGINITELQYAAVFDWELED